MELFGERIIISADEKTVDMVIDRGEGYYEHYTRRVKSRIVESDGRTFFELEKGPKNPDCKS